MHVSTQKRIGKYTIMRTLGSGGSCKVKLGLDTSTGKKVAVKIMNDDLDSKT
jgi:serine/threonine protein kinase